MDQYLLQLLVVAALLVLNAVFAGSEMALITLREGQLRRLERQSARGRAVATLARDPNRFLATIQIGITLAGFLASATAAVTLAGPLEPAFGFLGPAARPAAVVTVTVVLTFLTLVAGELAPKRVAMQRAEGWSLLAVRPLQLAAAVAAPAVWLLGRATNGLVRIAGADPTRQRDEITPAEVRDLVATHRGFTPEQRMIISGAVEITERTLRQVLVPRRQVFTLDAATALPAARRQLAASGHSRAPVVEHGNLDETVGVVNLRDLVTSEGPTGEGHAASGGLAAGEGLATGGGATLRSLARPPVLLPDSLHAAEALRRFQADRQQFALVVDEHGAVDGIVTLEDLVEEVIGEIYDETDRDVQAVRREADGSMVVPGVFPVHDLPDLGVYLERPPEGGYTTVAGLVLALLGHLPTRPGETVTVDGWSAQVVSVDHHAITSVRLRPPPQPA